MQNFFKTFVAQIQDFFGGLTPIKRMSLMASAGVGLAAVVTILMMSSGSDYAPLLSNVPPEQVSTVLNTLRAKNIPHRIEDNSGTILVPKSFLHSTQMTIMAEVGAGRIGQVGLELFDKQGLHEACLFSQVFRSLSLHALLFVFRIVLVVPTIYFHIHPV